MSAEDSLSMLTRSGTRHRIGAPAGPGRRETKCGTGWLYEAEQLRTGERRECKICFPTASSDFASSTLTDMQELTDERDQARDIAVRLEQENARMVDALQLISRHGCEGSVAPYNCQDAGRTRGAYYGADAWCDPCIALDALAAAPVDGAE